MKEPGSHDSAENFKIVQTVHLVLEVRILLTTRFLKLFQRSLLGKSDGFSVGDAYDSLGKYYLK